MVLFFDLLQIALGNKENFSTTPTKEQWQIIYDLSVRQALIGIAFLGIKKLPEAQRPPKHLLLKWFATTEKIKEINAEMNAKSRSVTKRFLKDGFRSLILKGQGIASLYPEGDFRMSGDIDVWVEGGRKIVSKYLRGIKKDCKVVYHHADFIQIGYTDIEVHFTPTWMNNYFSNNRLQRFFNEIKEKEFAKATESDFPTPSLKFNRIYLLVHIYRHLFSEGIGLRQLMDYYYVLAQGFSDEEREHCISVLKDLGMLRFTRAVMFVLQKAFGMRDELLLLAPNEKEGEFLLKEILIAGNFGQYDERINRSEGRSEWSLFINGIKRNSRFLWSYPSEVLWSPIFKIWHYIMRLKWNYFDSNKYLSKI